MTRAGIARGGARPRASGPPAGASLLACGGRRRSGRGARRRPDVARRRRRHAGPGAGDAGLRLRRAAPARGRRARRGARDRSAAARAPRSTASPIGSTRASTDEGAQGRPRRRRGARRRADRRDRRRRRRPASASIRARGRRRANAVVCLVAPVKLLTFPPATADGRGIAIEAIWGRVVARAGAVIGAAGLSREAGELPARGGDVGPAAVAQVGDARRARRGAPRTRATSPRRKGSRAALVDRVVGHDAEARANAGALLEAPDDRSARAAASSSVSFTPASGVTAHIGARPVARACSSAAARTSSSECAASMGMSVRRTSRAARCRSRGRGAPWAPRARAAGCRWGGPRCTR